MKANSGLKKNRTKIQMVLTALVILSVVRQDSQKHIVVISQEKLTYNR